MDDEPRILIVDDDPAAIAVLGRILEGLGRVQFATSGAGALALVETSTPDLVFLDVDMPEMSGFEVCREMKAMPSMHDVPILFLTGHNEAEYEIRGLNAGAVDFIAKPPRAALVRARARVHLRMRQLTNELRRAASTDALTQLANRRQLDEALAAEWRRAARARSSIAVALIDIDHFKLFNDHYGHIVGDDCLRAVARVMNGCIHRAGDLIARYGGEEFALLLPGVDRLGIVAVAERVLAAVADARIPHAMSPVSDHVTISVGTSVCIPPVTDAEETESLTVLDLVSAADQALYVAKEEGRHCVRYVSIDAYLDSKQSARGEAA